MTLQKLFADFKSMYWPIEAYVHARPSNTPLKIYNIRGF